MAKPSLFILIETAVVFIGGALLIFGLLSYNIGIQIWGIILSFIGFALTILITAGAEGEDDVDDITFVNALLYPLIVADVFAIGSWFDAIPTTQVLFLDLGVIMGLFLLFIYIWYLLKEKVKGGLAFLDMAVIDRDFHSKGEAKEYPKFFIVTLILGTIFGLLFMLFKGIYQLIADGFGTAIAYNRIAYILMIIIVVLSLAMAFGARLLDWWRTRKGKKPAKPAKPAAKPATTEKLKV